MAELGRVIVAISGGVDSAVAALLLRDAGHDVHGLHMTNWEDDGYCEAARDFQDARRVCKQLGLPLHRVNFAREYRAQVFEHFLDEHRRGRTPNPDVLCNREIKFGVMRRYAKRLGASTVATGHYARLEVHGSAPRLLKGRDAAKDQSYFLSMVDARDLVDVAFPLGNLRKPEVRAIARGARLVVSGKRDSTGICFIGERPFPEFLSRHLAAEPGVIRDESGRELGQHRGLPYYTLGQRQGLGIGGVAARAEAPWYVAAKDSEKNELIVVQGRDHALLRKSWLTASDVHWINGPPRQLAAGDALQCRAKIRYRHAEQACTVTPGGARRLEVEFEQPQWVPTPGQYVVFYDGDQCLGAAVIERAARRPTARATAPLGRERTAPTPGSTVAASTNHP
jgi:tRNA-specific 2-thiouridylase